MNHIFRSLWKYFFIRKSVIFSNCLVVMQEMRLLASFNCVAMINKYIYIIIYMYISYMNIVYFAYFLLCMKENQMFELNQP